MYYTTMKSLVLVTVSTIVASSKKCVTMRWCLSTVEEEEEEGEKKSKKKKALREREKKTTKEKKRREKIRDKTAEKEREREREGKNIKEKNTPIIAIPPRFKLGRVVWV